MRTKNSQMINAILKELMNFCELKERGFLI
jgi:hypothetical protein